uniref:Olfactory receptor n=1 Tax=Chrysemys picta bellii TaxID=8478 RepID=A0A8C3FBQ2_CHRPI
MITAGFKNYIRQLSLLSINNELHLTKSLVYFFNTQMEKGNQTNLKEFILFGFPGSWYLQISLFLLFLFMYILMLMGNITIISLVGTHRRLHTPMYFFLCNLSFPDICFTTAYIPKTLAILVSQSKTVSFPSCLLQMYFVFSLGCTEYLLLAAIAYDRYLAICHPLHYSSIMNSTLSIHLALGSWASSFLTISVPVFLIIRLSFCDPTTINHFFCDIDSWIELSCTDMHLVEMVYITICFTVILGSLVLFTSVVILGSSSFLFTLISYIHIISAILRIHSAECRHKAFSTCSSHLIVVGLLYLTAFFQYTKPSSVSSVVLDEMFSIQYSIMTPILNPIIYSLKNKEVKTAVGKMLRKFKFLK